MTRETPSLTDLRREIDRVDEALHDLLMRRAEMVDSVRQAKRGGSGGYLRPAREAEVLRRLLARHGGLLPRSLIVRLWREIMSAVVAMQGPFAVAVWDGGEGGFWDLARDHFGGLAPMTRHQTARGVIHAVSEGEATVGVLPAPEDGEADPWWPTLAGVAGQAPLRICGRLPFAPGSNGRGAGREALVVGDVPFEPSGNDHSYLVVESPAGVSRDSLTAALRQARLAPAALTVWRGGGVNASTLYLVQVPDFVGADDPRPEALAAAGGAVSAVRTLGGYATPVDGGGEERR